ncbi:MAG TPA: hypothetical protein VMV74_03485 [Bacteroidales bacterium]|nr:hypothetical protein [Bacteroidales bacterium]
MKRTIVLAVFLSFFFLSKGQDITVTSQPDTSVIYIGDQIHFKVTASLPENIAVNLFTAADTLSEKILILGKPVRDTLSMPDGNRAIIDDYVITSFEAGTYAIPPFYAEVASGDSIRRFYSDYSDLLVKRPEITPSDTTDVIFDIIAPRKAPLTFRDIVPYIILAGLMILIVWLLARYLPRNPIRRMMKQAPPAEPSHLIALRELGKLKDEQLWQKGEIKEYYSRLSEILRRYIDGRYGISSPELTTDETVRMLQRAVVLQQSEMTMIKEILSLSDMVKFAKYLPQEEIHENSFVSSVKFVEQTKQPEAAPVTTGDGKKGEGHA